MHELGSRSLEAAIREPFMNRSDALRRFIDAEDLFEVNVPSNWLADTSGHAGTRVAFTSPDTVLGFQANVNVIVQHVPPLTRDEFLTLSRLQLKVISGVPNLPIDQPADRRPDVHVFEWGNSHAPMPVHVLQQIFFSKKKAFVISATALESNFESYRATFQSIILSFQLNMN